MENRLPSLWNAYWKTLAFSAAPFEAVNNSLKGLWFSLRIFLVVALIANLGQLIVIADLTQEQTAVERIQQASDRLRETAEPLPLLLELPLNFIAGKLDEVAAGMAEFQPPLGVRSSRVIRALGDWLSGPLQLLGAWLGSSLLIWLVARFMGARGELRAHLSLLLLAIAPQAFYPLVDLLTNRVFSGFSMGYVNWALRLGLGAWSAVLLVIALATAHDIRRDRAAAILLVSGAIFGLLIPLIILLLGGAFIYRLIG